MTELRSTPAVEGIYIGQQLDVSHPGYWTAECAEIVGPVDVPRLADAINATVAEAQVLHTRYPGADRTRLGDPTGWRCRVATANSWSDVESEARRRLAVPADLAQGGLFDTVLFTGPDRVWWYVQAHHIVLDGFGYALLYRQVAKRYRGAPVRAFESLAELSRHEEAYRHSQSALEHRDWWVDYLEGGSAASFGTQHATPGHSPRRTALDSGDLASIATWPHRLLAATAAAVHDRTASPRPLLGVPVAGRMGAVPATVPGMVMNISPLAVDIGLNDTLDEVTATVEQQLSLTRPRQRYRHEWLRSDLGLIPGQRLFGPVVNIVPFAEPPPLPDCQVRMRHLSAGPVDDISITARGPDQITLEANPEVYDADALDDIRESITNQLHGKQRIARWRRLPSQPPALTTTLPEALSARASDDATAIIDGDRTLSYRELNARIQTVAGGLSAHGITEGDVVALRLPRGRDAIVAMLAILHVGATYLPIDPNGAPERRQAILREAAPKLTLDSPSLPEAAPLAQACWPSESAAYLMYTSGTTGKPKAVAIPRRALDFFSDAASRHYGFKTGDRVLQFAPLHFDTHVEEVYAAFQAGATVVVGDDSATESLPRFVDFVAARGVTVLDLPTAYWHELALALRDGLVALPDTLRTVIIGGEAVDPTRVREWHASVDDRIRLINTYGPTETTVACLAADLRRNESICLGRPLRGVRAAVGPKDELYIAGPGLAAYRTPEASDGFTCVDGQDWYRTGDIVASRPDGQLDYIGRVDAQLKISGHRVRPEEVEAALTAHPMVREAAVIAVTSATRTRLVAHVVAPADISDAELLETTAQRLAAAARPSQFVRHDRLPRTSTGKIDRRALPAETVPETTVAPSTTMERTIFEVFEAVLGAPPRSLDEDFFSSGGTSLSAVAAAARLSARLGREVTAAGLFHHSTVSRLAAALEGTADSEEDPTELITADRAWQVPAANPVSQTDGTIVLTGATGFVGSHLLAALLHHTDAPVRLLTRGGTERLSESAVAFGLPVLDLERVEIVQCDFSSPNLAMTPTEWQRLSRATAIVNCAADVGFSRGYRGLRHSNVVGLRALLETGTRVHQISTVAVGAGEDLPESWVEARAGLSDGYQTTKWVAEELLRQAEAAGRPVACHRLGRVVATGGTTNPRDFVTLCVRAGLQVGALPAFDFHEPWMTVTDTADCLARLVIDGHTGVWNLVSGRPVQLRSAWEGLRRAGAAVDIVSPAQWARELERHPEADQLGVLRAFIAAHGDTTVSAPIRNERFLDWLRAKAIPEPEVDLAEAFATLLPMPEQR